MTQLEEAISKFCESVRQHLPKARFGQAKSTTLTAAKKKVTLPEELIKFYQDADPTLVKVPSLDGEITLYPSRHLLTKQKGFRFHPKTGRKLPEWNENWLVIGDEDGDPFIIDTRLKRPPHAVYRDYLDTEEWSPTRVADSLPQFLDLLRVWVDIIVGDCNLKITDKDDQLLPSVEAKLSPRVEAITDDPDLIDYWTYPAG
ncbi:MAG: SMI1/KNR4 family protein [Planctomycetota bacterium]